MGITQEQFEDALTRGLAFERGAATTALHKKFPTYIINRVAKDPVENHGPRAYRGDKKQEAFVLPDFHLFHPETQARLWVDAKLKGKPISGKALARDGELAVTLDKRAHNEYAHTMSVMPGRLYILFGLEDNRTMYLGAWNPNPETVMFNNQWGSGAVPIYYLSDMEDLGKF